MEKPGHSVTESQTLGHVVTLSRSHAVMEKPGHSVTESQTLGHVVTLSRTKKKTW